MYMLCLLNLCIGAFTVQPTSVVQAEGVTAQFTCQNQDAIKLTWSIGGVFLSHHHPPNVTVERNMLLVSTLNLLVLQYNIYTVQGNINCSS